MCGNSVHEEFELEIQTSIQKLVEDDKIDELISLLEARPERVNELHESYQLDTALHVACLRDNSRAVDELVRRGADLFACSNMGDNPLFLATFMGSIRIVMILVDNGGIDVNIMKKQGVYFVVLPRTSEKLFMKGLKIC